MINIPRHKILVSLLQQPKEQWVNEINKLDKTSLYYLYLVGNNICNRLDDKDPQVRHRTKTELNDLNKTYGII